MPEEPKTVPEPVNAPNTVVNVRENTTIASGEEVRFRWAERIGIGPVMALVCLGMIFYSLINSVNMLQTLVNNTTTALNQVAEAVKGMKETVDESKKESAERQKVIEARQKENDAKFLAIQQAVIANQTIMKQDVELSNKLLDNETKAQADRKSFWEPAGKDLAAMKAEMSKMSASDGRREELQTKILAEQKKQAECERAHADAVEKLMKDSKIPTPVPNK